MWYWNETLTGTGLWFWNTYRKPPRTSTFYAVFSLYSVRGRHWIKSTNEREGTWYINCEAASGTILRISKGFQRIKQSFIFIFSLTRQPKNKKRCINIRHRLNFKGLQKIFILWRIPFYTRLLGFCIEPDHNLFKWFRAMMSIEFSSIVVFLLSMHYFY